MRNPVKITLVAAMTKYERCIGKENTLPWSLPEDLRHFKKVTTGKVVVMGRKTFESIGKPLPNRVNVVLSNDLDYVPEGVTVCASLDEVLFLADDRWSELVVIGGGSLYQQTLPLADTLILSELDISVKDGDTFFPEVKSEEFEVTHTDYRYTMGSESGIAFDIVTYQRRT